MHKKLYIAAKTGAFFGLSIKLNNKNDYDLIIKLSEKYAKTLETMIEDNLSKQEEFLVYELSKIIWEGKKINIKYNIEMICLFVKVLYIYIKSLLEIDLIN